MLIEDVFMTNWAAKCSDLRIKLHAIDNTLDQMRTSAVAISHEAWSAAEGQFLQIGDRIEDDQARTEKAAAAVRKWVEHRRDAGNAQRTEWQSHRDHVALNRRADEAEAYVVAVFELASAAVREAAHAVLEAGLARYDANVASLPERSEP